MTDVTQGVGTSRLVDPSPNQGSWGITHAQPVHEVPTPDSDRPPPVCYHVYGLRYPEETAEDDSERDPVDLLDFLRPSPNGHPH